MFLITLWFDFNSNQIFFTTFLTSMYAEIPADAIPTLKPRLQEMKVLYMTNIKIENAKPVFKPVSDKAQQANRDYTTPR